MDKTDPKIIVSEPQRISPDALAHHAAADSSSSATHAKGGHDSDISGRMTALTIGAGLMGRTLWQLSHVNSGLDTNGVVSARISLGHDACPPFDRCRAEMQRIEADLAGDYLQLVRFINTLERSKMFFDVDSVDLAGENTGQVKLEIVIHSYLRSGA